MSNCPAIHLFHQEGNKERASPRAPLPPSGPPKELQLGQKHRPPRGGRRDQILPSLYPPWRHHSSGHTAAAPQTVITLNSDLLCGSHLSSTGWASHTGSPGAVSSLKPLAPGSPRKTCQLVGTLEVTNSSSNQFQGALMNTSEGVWTHVGNEGKAPASESLRFRHGGGRRGRASIPGAFVGIRKGARVQPV